MQTQKHKMQELQEAVAKNGPLCVGLDTDSSYIPDSVIKSIGSPEEAVLTYNKEIIRRVALEKTAATFKIQIAYYEAMGIKGMEVYAKTLKAVHEAGFISISDVKRGDIASSASAYARAHFSGDFETDIITINPYMGFDTIEPYTQYFKPANGSDSKKIGLKGAFVLLCTSNPGMTDIEHQKLQDGSILLEKVGDEIVRIGEKFSEIYENQTCFPIGAVVGATQENDARNLRDKYPKTFFLIPGYGVQGGDAKIASILLEKAGGIVNSSRAILCAWKKDENLAEKRESGSLSISDIATSALNATITAKNDLLNGKNVV